MKVDWLIVGAQVVNFLVLVWLLRRFLYRPVLAAMARREQHVGERLRTADERERQAALARERYDEQRVQIDAERERLLEAARTEADAERRMLRAQARAEVEAADARWRLDLAREQAQFAVDLRREVGAAALAVAGEFLAELAGADLQQRMVQRLLTRLDDLDADERAALIGSDEGVVVRTAWPLTGEEQAEIDGQLRGRLGRSIPVRWRRDADLVCGVALEGGGHRLDWNVAGRLDALDEQLRERLSALSADGAAAGRG